MKAFVMNNPTALHFGQGVIEEVGNTVAQYGKKALLIYGKGSVKQNGFYDLVVDRLKTASVEYVEYGGIKSNPVIEDVRAAIVLGKKENVDVVLALGGGSVLDTAKIASLGLVTNAEAWDIMTHRTAVKDALPLVTVLTLAAAGSEMNGGAVIQNNKTNQKLGFHSRLIFPRHSFLDPSVTLTVPRNYTAYGIADLLAHCLEAWFGKGEATLSDRFVLAVMKEAIEYGPQLLDDLGNYRLREKIMYAATCALNELTLYGRESGDWGIHQTGHVLSVLYDIPHGASLTITIPAWMKLMQHPAGDRIVQLGQNLFGVSSVEDSILKTEELFSRMGCPVSLTEWGIEKTAQSQICEVMHFNKVSGASYPLTDQRREDLVSLMF